MIRSKKRRRSVSDSDDRVVKRKKTCESLPIEIYAKIMEYLETRYLPILRLVSRNINSHATYEMSKRTDLTMDVYRTNYYSKSIKFINKFIRLCIEFDTKLPLDKIYRMLEMIILIKCDPNKICVIEHGKWTTLIILISQYSKHLLTDRFIKKYISYGCNLDVRDSDGNTALTRSLLNFRYSTLETIRILIDSNIKLNGKNGRGDTALMIVSNHCNTFYYTTNISPYKLDIMKMLIDGGSDMNLKNKYGKTALMLALREFELGDTDKGIRKIKMLIDHSADVTLIDDDRKNLLMQLFHAIGENIPDEKVIELVELLIHAGVNLDDVDIRGDTSLMIATKYCKMELLERIIRIYIREGANLNIKNNRNYTILTILAVQHNNPFSTKKLVRMLVDAGCVLPFDGRFGWSTLVKKEVFKTGNNKRNIPTLRRYTLK